MSRVIHGQLFAQTVEDMEAMMEVLEAAGFVPEYISQQNAVITKEVEEVEDGAEN